MFEDWPNDIKNNFEKQRHIPSNLIYKSSTCSDTEYLVSVTIPTFRRANDLKRAIQSAAKQNTNIAYEIIVVDNDNEVDEATDRLAKECAEKYSNFYYYRNRQNLGMFGNWNRCFELAHGKWLCILHDDDRLQPAYIETVSHVLNFSEVGIIGVFPCFMERIGSQYLETKKCQKANKIKRIINYLSHGKTLNVRLKEYRRNIIPNATGCIYDRKKAIAAGGFDPEINFDLVFYAKMGALYGTSIIPQLLTFRTISTENLSNNNKVIIECAKKIKLLADRIAQVDSPTCKLFSNFLTISFIDNNRKKYNTCLSKAHVLDEAGLSSIWQYIPSFIITLTEAFSWLLLILRNKFNLKN